MTEHIIDAKNQTLGRLCGKISHLLQGKNTAAYNPRLQGGNKVIVKNASLVKVTGRKYDQKMYYRHTNYMGHLRERTYKMIAEQKPEEILKKAVYGMLPKNAMRRKRMKALIIEK